MSAIAGNGPGLFGRVRAPYNLLEPLGKVTDSSVHGVELIEVSGRAGVTFDDLAAHAARNKNRTEMNRI